MTLTWIVCYLTLQYFHQDFIEYFSWNTYFCELLYNENSININLSKAKANIAAQKFNLFTEK